MNPNDYADPVAAYAGQLAADAVVHVTARLILTPAAWRRRMLEAVTTTLIELAELPDEDLSDPAQVERMLREIGRRHVHAIALAKEQARRDQPPGPGGGP